MNGGEALAIVFTTGTLAGSVVYLIRASLEHARATRTERVQADLYTRMLDKFGSSQDLLAYLGTEAGRSLLKPASTPADVKAPAPTRRIMNSVQIGSVLIFMGIALLLIREALRHEGPEEALTIFGILGLMTGIGFLVSAFASWKLSKAWGLLPMQGKEE